MTSIRLGCAACELPRIREKEVSSAIGPGACVGRADAPRGVRVARRQHTEKHRTPAGTGCATCPTHPGDRARPLEAAVTGRLPVRLRLAHRSTTLLCRNGPWINRHRYRHGPIQSVVACKTLRPNGRRALMATRPDESAVHTTARVPLCGSRLPRTAPSGGPATSTHAAAHGPRWTGACVLHVSDATPGNFQTFASSSQPLRRSR